MKSLIKNKILQLTVLLMAVASCTGDFEELNTPPTTLSYIDPGIIISNTQKNFGFSEGYEYPNNQFGSWVQHWAGGVLISQSRYIQTPDNSTWDSHYSLIRDLSQIRNHLLKGGENDPKSRTKLAIARILEVAVWQRLTDLFGDVPYSESALGISDIINQPKFDTQESIYPSLISTLDAAITQLNDTDASYGAADYFYKGNAAKWRKFGNSLKLQLGMRLRYANPALAQKTVTEAMSQPLLESNSDNAMIPTFNDATNSNVHPILNQGLTGSPDLKYLASTFIDVLKNTNDPRLTKIAQPTANSVKTGNLEYRGIGVALTDELLKTIIKEDHSTVSQQTFFNKTFNPAIPCLVFTFSDVSFFKAEAALEGWGATDSDAEKFYQEGVKAAMAQSPYNITQLNADFTELSFAGLTKAQKLEKIGTQKWIQLFGRSFEAFIEWRRMGYPKLTPGPNLGSTNGTIPRRAVYSSNEAILNKDNYTEAAGRLSSGDSYVSRIWTDKH